MNTQPHDIITIEVSSKMTNGKEQIELLLDFLSIDNDEYSFIESKRTVRFQWEGEERARSLIDFINECTVLTATRVI